MKTLTLDLTDEEHALLTDLASYLNHTPVSLLRRSLERLLGEQRAKLSMIEEARRSHERGDVYTLEEADRIMAEYIDELDRTRLSAAAAE